MKKKDRDDMPINQELEICIEYPRRKGPVSASHKPLTPYPITLLTLSN